jgi:hypothetical protein
MLILCYGITKSGSTLAFELVKGALASAGHPQVRLPDGTVEPGHNVNFIARKLGRNRLETLLDQIGTERRIAVKTHADFLLPLFPWIEEMQARREVQIVASYRDPRDICVSLMDAGKLARKDGRKAFSLIQSLSDAAESVQRQIAKFRNWGSVHGALRLSYELVAFSPDKALDAIEHLLDVRCDRAAAKKHAFEDAFTQKNLGGIDRFKTELSAEEQRQLTEKFEAFIRQVCEEQREVWFTEHRNQVLEKLARHSLMGSQTTLRRRAPA